MPGLHRRAFLSAAAATCAAPALAATTSPSAALDVVIIGAGAAGIGAARRIAAAGRRYVVLEAADHVGGRCVTDRRIFGVPYDLGAHWIHAPNLNPLTKLGTRRGIEVYPAPASQKVRIGRRDAREGEMEDFLASQVRANRAIVEAARKADVACEQTLPHDLGDWRPTVEFALGPYTCAKELEQVSVLDFARSQDREAAAFCRQGYGALLAALADGLSVRFSTPALAVDWRRGVAVETPKGSITARAVIITVSTNVIASGAVKFTPDLTPSQLDMFGKLALGSFDHVALALADNPLGFESDDLVFEKSADKHTAAILANVGGTPLCLIQIAGSFGRELSAQGGAAMVDFAADWLAKPLRRRRQEGGEALTCDALEPRSADAWRVLGGGAGLAKSPPHAHAAGERLGMVRRRSAARDALGHGRRRLGIWRARRGRSVAPARRREGSAGRRSSTTGAAKAAGAPRPAAGNRGSAKPVRALSRAETSYARSTAPVRLPASPTIFAASASISASVMVLSRGWMVTEIAIDFLPGSIPVPS